MDKVIINERRSPSIIKPIIYLFLELIIVAEMFYITTTTTPYKEIMYDASAIVVIFLIHKTFKVIKRTAHLRTKKRVKSVFSKNLSLSSLIIR